MKPITCLRVLMWSFVVITMIAIFTFSHQNGEKSSQISDKVINNVVEDANNLKSEPSEYIRVVYIVRKSAHVLIYAVLGFFLMGALSLYNGRWYNHYLISAIIGTLYAASDEWHQTFIPERLGSIKDVGIDFLGLIFGITIMLLTVTIINKIKNTKHLPE